MRVISIAAIVLLLYAARSFALTDDLDSAQRFVTQKLRTYCNACHGVGELRFIYSDDDLAMWNYIFSNNAPTAKVLWAKQIVALLDWPDDEAPPGSQTQWMPKGAKRLELAADNENGESTRRRLIAILRSHFNDYKD